MIFLGEQEPSINQFPGKNVVFFCKIDDERRLKKVDIENIINKRGLERVKEPENRAWYFM